MNSRSKIINQLVRPEFLNLPPYPASFTSEQLAKQLDISPRQIIKLNSAENSSVERFYPRKINSAYYSYPDPLCVKLRQAIGQYVGFGPDWIACGNGSDELIDLLIALFVGRNEEILLCPPTFPMYEFCSKVRGVRIRKVPRNMSLAINTKKLQAAVVKKTKLIFIDSPGNPAGTLIGRNDLVRLLRKKVMVVVDEAYFEYSGKTVAPLVKKFPNLIVLRSFSKWAGLAGLRVGYLIASPKIIETFLLIKPPYNVNSAAQELALVALSKKNKILKELKKSLSLKRRIVKALSKFKDFKVRAGDGSYILVQLKEGDVQQLIKKLKVKGIIVKPINQNGLANSFLVSVEKENKMNRFVKFLNLIISKK
jgi:histidinol-phosphate aminotransferase